MQSVSSPPHKRLNVHLECIVSTATNASRKQTDQIVPSCSHIHPSVGLSQSECLSPTPSSEEEVDCGAKESTTLPCSSPPAAGGPGADDGGGTEVGWPAWEMVL
mmetsp:Transcript_41858/g.118715  ORF Transcript_41858/g.118715 Transcript_41858/m.118715 type:complete len:104 (+) Transcript_41858:1118-1429(+)